MHLPMLAVFFAWIAVGVFLFRRYPGRIAVLATFFGGWAILPAARYPPVTDEFPYWILGVCLPTGFLLTKATVTALAALAGFFLFRISDAKQFRPGLCDIPMALWCCIPLLSAVRHPDTIQEALGGAAYQTIAWGIPWFLGRIYFSDHESLLLAAKACVIAGVCYVPVCLVEFFTGPQIYGLLYGYEPYRWVGAERYIGFRPIGLLEDGNQLGIWMAVATLVAASLAIHRLTPRILGLPTGWVAAGLAMVTLMCQSAGSILLLVVLLPFTLLNRKLLPITAVAVLILGVLGLGAFLVTGHGSLRALAESNGLLRSIAYDLSSIGRHSFVWRVSRDVSHLPVALQHPLLGSGHWDWWHTGKERPWSLWLLAFGMYGGVGFLALAGILFLPFVRASWSPTDPRNPQAAHLLAAMAGLIFMVALDDLLNSAMILPYLLLMGGLAAGRALPRVRNAVPKTR